MKNITIFTHNHIQQLTDFYLNEVENYATNISTDNNQLSFTISEEYINYPLITDILIDIILDKNTLVSGQVKLFDMLKSIVFAGKAEQIAKNIEKFALQTETLNIDGYLNFRLNNYEEKINSVLYSVVKQSLSFEY